jgi:glutathione S-transferase
VWIALEETGQHYEMVELNKLDMPQTYVELYSRANPLPGVRAKVPLLQVETVVAVHGTRCDTKDPDTEEGDEDSTTTCASPSTTLATTITDSTVLCESLILSEYVAEQFGKENELSSNPQQQQQRQKLIPLPPQDRAMLRLFQELCGATFSYLPLLRAPNYHQLTVERHALETRLIAMNSFLVRRQSRRQHQCHHHHFSSSCSSNSQKICTNENDKNNDGGGLETVRGGPFLLGGLFSLAECNMAPFVQRCCSILPLAGSGTDNIHNNDNTNIINGNNSNTTEAALHQESSSNNNNTQRDSLSSSSTSSSQSFHPLDICSDLGLVPLEQWIHAVLARPSVQATGPSPDGMAKKRNQFQKRMVRLIETR